MQRPRHSCAGDLHYTAARVAQGVLHGGVTTRDAADGQAAIQSGQHAGGRLASLVYPTQRAYRQCRVERRRQTLAANVSQIYANGFVGERKIVQEITAYFGGGFERVG